MVEQAKVRYLSFDGLANGLAWVAITLNSRSRSTGLRQNPAFMCLLAD